MLHGNCSNMSIKNALKTLPNPPPLAPNKIFLFIANLVVIMFGKV